MRKKLSALALSLLLLVSLCGCGEGNPAASSSAPPEIRPSASASQSAAEIPAAVQEPIGMNPLTGMPMEESEEGKRPVAVMLNDLKAAQPQLGVARADIIYEVPAEGGITRMLALYQSLEGVGNLGSIRSTRPYYLELALGHDALLVHAGGSPEAYQDIAAWGVDNMDGVNGGSDQEIFWRDPVRRKTAGYEHSMLTSGKNIQDYLDAGHFSLTHSEKYQNSQSFADDGTPAGGTAASHISVRYSPYKTATFDYDAAGGKYLVGQFGGAYVDGNTGEQVGVTNVLTLRTDIHIISGDTAGRLTVRMTGEGEGTFFCGGVCVPIRWSKASRTAPFAYTLADGSPLMPGRGNTYVCILSGRDGSVSVT